MKDYKTKLREIEQEKRMQKEEDEERKKKQPFKMKQFKAVESRINSDTASTVAAIGGVTNAFARLPKGAKPEPPSSAAPSQTRNKENFSPAANIGPEGEEMPIGDPEDNVISDEYAQLSSFPEDALTNLPPEAKT